MSKQSEAKQRQGYDPKPKHAVCANCAEFSSDIVSKTTPWAEVYKEEKNLRCGIGGFAVKKGGTCIKHSWRTEGGA